MNVFAGNEQVATSVVAAEIGFTDNQMTDLYNRDLKTLEAILPPKPDKMGKARYYNRAQFGMACLLSDLVAAEFKVPLAAKIAQFVLAAHEREPDVEQFAVVHTANGNISTLPYSRALLETGFVSGARLKFGIVIDLKNYADRVTVAIANAPRVIGGEDGK